MFIVVWINLLLVELDGLASLFATWLEPNVPIDKFEETKSNHQNRLKKTPNIPIFFLSCIYKKNSTECALHAYSYYFILPQNVHYMMSPSSQYPSQYPSQYYHQCQRLTQHKSQRKQNCHQYQQPYYQPYPYHLAQYHMNPGLQLSTTQTNQNKIQNQFIFLPFFFSLSLCEFTLSVSCAFYLHLSLYLLYNMYKHKYFSKNKPCSILLLLLSFTFSRPIFVFIVLQSTKP